MTILLRQKPLTQVVRQIVQRDSGAWFDPEDMSTMFQDAAGTIPVTAVEQPVGLWLDKSQGLQLGPELITNGDFSNGTAWSYGTAPQVTASSSISDGVCTSTMTNSTGGGYDHSVKQSLSITGKTLLISAQCISVTGTVTARVAVRSYNGSAYSYSYMTFTSGQSKSFLHTVPNGYLTDQIWLSILSVSTGSAGTVVWDNISVREIKGNHATQSITASRPTLSARYNWLLNSATLSTQSVTTVAAPYTLSFTGTGSVTLSGSATGTLAGTGVNDRVSLAFTPTAGTLTLTVTGSVALAMLAFGTLTMYQAITTATNYDSAGWPRYLRFDGVDDYLNLPYMGLYANGSASVVVSASLASQGTYAFMFAEANTTTSNTRYSIGAQFPSGRSLAAVIRRDDGVYISPATSSGILANARPQIRSMVDSGSSVRFVLQGGQIDQTSTYTRSGVLTPTTTAIGCVVSTANTGYCAMNTYGFIITKSALSDTDRSRCEQFLASWLSTLGVALS